MPETIEDRLGPPVLARCAMAAFAVATLYSGLAQYGHALGGPKPLYFIAAVVAGCAAVLVAESNRPGTVFRSWPLFWAYAYLLMSTAWAALWRPKFTTMADQALVDRFRCVFFFVAMILVFADRRARTIGRIAVLAVVIGASVVNLAEASGLLEFHDTVRRFAGRASGLYVNPNQAGFSIVFGLAVALPIVPRILRVPVVLLAASGVAATFSRGSLACLTVLVLVLLWRRDITPWSAVIAIGGIAAAFLYLGIEPQSLLESSGRLNDDTLARLTMRADDSGRVGLARKAWNLFAESPWLGHGLASEREGRMSHNMYLSLAAEHGVLGLIAFPALIVAFSVGNPAAIPAAAVFLFAGLFSHNLLEEEPALLCIALAASSALAFAPSRSTEAPLDAEPTERATG